MTRSKLATGHPILGRGDLVDAIATRQPEILHAVALQLGLVWRPPETKAADPTRRAVSVDPQIPPIPQIDSTGYPDAIENIALWAPGRFAMLAPLEDLPEGKAYLEWQVEPHAEKTQQQLLAPWSVVGSRLRRGLAEFQHGRHPDLPALVDLMAKRELISEIPRQQKRRWGQNVQIIKDFSLRLTPFQHDQEAIIDRIRKILPPGSLQIADGDSPYSLSLRPGDHIEKIDDAQAYLVPPPGTRVLVLGDLGCLTESQDLWKLWLEWGRRLHRQGCRLLALVPCSEKQIPAALMDTFAVQTWQKSRTAWISDPHVRASAVARLLVLAAPALRLEPGLLRDLRLLDPDAGDATLETDVWNSELLSSNHPIAATIDPRIANEKLRPEFEALPKDLRRQVLQCIRNWRLNIQRAPEIWFEELLCLSAASRHLLPKQSDLKDARASVRELDRLRRSAGNDGEAVAAWLHGSTLRLTKAAYRDRQVGRILRETLRHLHPERKGVAEGTDPREIAAGELGRYGLEINDREVRIIRHDADQTKSANATTVAVIRSSNQHFEIFDGSSNDEASFWKHGKKPDYASNFGTDRFGAWFEFQVPRRDGTGVVTQRMRWIRAGTFLMGSPQAERDRGSDETQHEVKLSRGYWLADTACTQELWEAVTGESPSHFNGDRRPVEQVSYDQVIKFVSVLAKLVPELAPALPTEAQWEYACRARTETPFSFGDAITWEQVNFDGRHPYGDPPKGEYRLQTVEVKSLSANRWGLYEMHGNVWEWCRDSYGEYSTASQVDPAGPATGSYRVVRGGSWYNVARYVRSACRRWDDPGFRSNFLGFRLLSSGSAEPTEAAEVPVAEQGSQQTRGGGATSSPPLPWQEERDGVRGLDAKTIRVDADTTAEVELTSLGPIRIRSNLEEVVLQRITKPPWAVEFGRDSFGTYADFEISSAADSPPVCQRMRWIPPGKFQMGSPKTEPGRYDNEIQHAVTISTGFWMFDTPCTQALWLAVMPGENPSYFPDLLRPVEKVDWAQAQEFAERLAKKVPDLSFSLPREAQWEYACRAGTSTAIYTGPLEILGDANAPELDVIAWYGGNSGREFDHERSVDVSSVTWLREKQYTFKSAGTRRVKQKRPNPWGLYDMLGNVWEWCQDWIGDYPLEAQVDPMGPEKGSDCVVRGGCWYRDSRYVRSASRGKRNPGNENSLLGFRLLSSASPVRRVSGVGPQPPPGPGPDPDPPPVVKAEHVRIAIVEDTLNRSPSTAIVLNALVGWKEFWNAGNVYRLYDQSTKEPNGLKAIVDIGTTRLPAMVAYDSESGAVLEMRQLPLTFDRFKEVAEGLVH